MTRTEIGIVYLALGIETTTPKPTHYYPWFLGVREVGPCVLWVETSNSDASGVRSHINAYWGPGVLEGSVGRRRPDRGWDVVHRRHFNCDTPQELYDLLVQVIGEIAKHDSN